MTGAWMHDLNGHRRGGQWREILALAFSDTAPNYAAVVLLEDWRAVFLGPCRQLTATAHVGKNSVVPIERHGAQP